MGYTMNKQYQKSLLNAYANTNQTIAANETINFSNSNILTGCSIVFNAGSAAIQLKKPGVYLVSFNANVAEGGTLGIISAQLAKNGININGAISSVDSTAAGDVGNINFNTLIKVLPSCCSIDNTTTLTVVNSGIEAIYSNANITVVKLC